MFPSVILSINWTKPGFLLVIYQRLWRELFRSIGVCDARKFEMRESYFSSEHQRKFVKRESFCRKSAAHWRLLAGSGHQGAMPWPASKIPCVCLPPRGRGRGATLGCVSCKSHATAFDANLSGAVQLRVSFAMYLCSSISTK